MNRVIANNRPVLPDEPVDNVNVDVVNVNVLRLMKMSMTERSTAPHDVIRRTLIRMGGSSWPKIPASVLAESHCNVIGIVVGSNMAPFEVV